MNSNPFVTELNTIYRIYHLISGSKYTGYEARDIVEYQDYLETRIKEISNNYAVSLGYADFLEFVVKANLFDTKTVTSASWNASDVLVTYQARTVSDVKPSYVLISLYERKVESFNKDFEQAKQEASRLGLI